MLTIKRIWYEILYAINRILFPPAKVMFIIWTWCLLAVYIFNRTFPKSSEYIAIVIGYLIYCGLADLLYYAFQKKYHKYKLKISQKHMKRLKALMDEIDSDYFTEHFTEDFKQKKI